MTSKGTTAGKKELSSGGEGGGLNPGNTTKQATVSRGLTTVWGNQLHQKELVDRETYAEVLTTIP